MTELLLNLLQRNEGRIFEFVVNIIEHYNRFDDIMIERGGQRLPFCCILVVTIIGEGRVYGA